MTKYIDADALKKEIQDMGDITSRDSWTAEGKHKAYAEIIASITRMPAADVELVEHGEWAKLDVHSGMEQYKCSACGSAVYVPECMGEPLYSYYPVCGTKMGGGSE